jgi:hypothetical protein
MADVCQGCGELSRKCRCTGKLGLDLRRTPRSPALEESPTLTDEEIADLHPEWSGSLVTRVRQG